MSEKVEFEPDYAIPPMETLKEILEERRITLSRLSKMTGLDYDEVLLKVMEVKKPIDENIASKLEKALSIPAAFWLNLEKNYQQTLKRFNQ